MNFTRQVGLLPPAPGNCCYAAASILLHAAFFPLVIALGCSYSGVSGCKITSTGLTPGPYQVGQIGQWCS